MISALIAVCQVDVRQDMRHNPHFSFLPYEKLIESAGKTIGCKVVKIYKKLKICRPDPRKYCIFIVCHSMALDELGRAGLKMSLCFHAVLTNFGPFDKVRNHKGAR